MFSKVKRWWKNVKLSTTYQDRLSWADYALEQAGIITQHPDVQKNLPEAQERFEYLSERHVVVVPRILESNETQLHAITRPKILNREYLGLCPLLPGDSIKEKVSTKDVDGFYASVMNTVFMDMQCQETDCRIGAILLHEAGHAITAQRESRILKEDESYDSDALIEEELRMIRFDYQLALCLGGPQFRENVEESVQRIVARIADGDNPAKIIIEAGLPLDLSYGPVNNEDRAKKRNTLYTSYCHLMALERALPFWLAHRISLGVIEWITQNHYTKEKEAFDERKKITL